MNKPHKHAELIKAWADGVEIEIFLPAGYWTTCHDPYWVDSSIYRIKPQKKSLGELFSNSLGNDKYSSFSLATRDYYQISAENFLKLVKENGYSLPGDSE